MFSSVGNHPRLTSLLLLAAFYFVSAESSSGEDFTLDQLLTQFEEYSGARIVFEQDELPKGRYHDVMKPLPVEHRRDAAQICLNASRRYPPGFLGEIGLKTIGVFAACASVKGDQYHTYDNQLGGYRYYGVYNGRDAIAAAFYTTGQLEQTFHHEVFHHVDSTQNGVTAKWLLSSDDAHYQAALSGLRRYRPPRISQRNMTALRSHCLGLRLRGAVSSYAAKNPREDQAETARHLMTMTADSLVQIIEQPELAGSQRILHLIGEYQSAAKNGPDVKWFVDLALQRTPNQSAQRLRHALGVLSTPDRWGRTRARYQAQAARQTLREVAELDGTSVPIEIRQELIRLSQRLTQRLMLERMAPNPARSEFVVYGKEDSNGINRTLRGDIHQYRRDALVFAKIRQLDTRQTHSPDPSQLIHLRLLAQYYAFIHRNWTITSGTTLVFQRAQRAFAAAAGGGLKETISRMQLLELVNKISPEGQWRP